MIAEEQRAAMRLHLVCPLELRLVSMTRRYVCDFARSIDIDPDTVERLMVAVHELMENSVKYSIGPEAELSVEIEQGEQRGFTIRASNRIDEQRLGDLRERMDEIRETPDPMDCYDAVIRRSLSRGDDESGLGLARIRAEAEMELSYQVQGDRVTISAHGERSQSGRT